jgi:hypothetical protein
VKLLIAKIRWGPRRMASGPEDADVVGLASKICLFRVTSRFTTPACGNLLKGSCLVSPGTYWSATIV